MAIASAVACNSTLHSLEYVIYKHMIILWIFTAHVSSIQRNELGYTGERALAEAIASNAKCSLTVLHGVRLELFADILGLSLSQTCSANVVLFTHMRIRNRAKVVELADTLR
jgi:hypothetical protein